MGDLRLVASRIASALAQAVILIILARTSGVDEFGEFGIALAIGAITIGVLGFGLPTRVLLLGGSGHFSDRRTIRALALILALAAVPIIGLFSALIAGEVSPAMVAGALYSAGELAVNIFQAHLFGTKQLRRAELLLLTRRLIPLAFVVGAAIVEASHAGGTVNPYIALICGTTLAVVMSHALAIERTASSWASAYTQLKESKSFWLTNIGSMAQQLDVVMVGGMVGSGAAAGFTAAFRLASPVHIVTSLITSRLGPELKHSTGSDQSAWRARRYFQFGVLYAVLVLLLAPLIGVLAPLLLGESYAHFFWVFVILFGNSALSVINQMLMIRAFARETGSGSVALKNALATSVGLFVVLAACLVGNVELAAMGTLSIQVILMLLLLLHAPRSRMDPL